MNQRHIHRQALNLASLALAAGAAVPLYSWAAPTPAVQIAVHADAFVASGRRYDDLASLVQALRSGGARKVVLTDCSDSARRATESAAFALREWPLELRVAYGYDAACKAPPPIARVSLRRPGAALLDGVDPQAVERYWASVAP